jgi:hypothetical protein
MQHGIRQWHPQAPNIPNFNVSAALVFSHGIKDRYWGLIFVGLKIEQTFTRANSFGPTKNCHVTNIKYQNINIFPDIGIEVNAIAMHLNFSIQTKPRISMNFLWTNDQDRRRDNFLAGSCHQGTDVQLCWFTYFSLTCIGLGALGGNKNFPHCTKKT